MCQQQSQQQQQQPVEQPYASQQDLNSESSDYEYDAMGGQRPSSRGSKLSVDSNGSSYSGGYNQYHLSNQQQQQQGQYGSQLDDDDDDMW